MAPTTSSIFKRSSNGTVRITSTLPIPPIKIARSGVGASGSAVIATSPPSAPFNAMVKSTLPYRMLVPIIATTTPAAAARFVLI